MTHANEMDFGPIAVAGAGSIGVRLAAAFLVAGSEVRLFDPDPRRREALGGEISEAIADIEAADLAEKNPSCVHRLSVHDKVEEAAAGAAFAIECGPERVELKRQIARDLFAALPADAILASASSALTASEIAGPLAEQDRTRFLIMHPINPPHIIRLLEVVPAPFTSDTATRQAMKLARRCGYSPVLVEREVTGFVYNRLQGAVLREAYCLVRDGVITVDALDRLVREALGMRWSVLGPFETVDLNTRGGIAVHAERLGPAYAKMGAERGQDDPWTDELVAKVAAARRAALPLDRWPDAVRQRDRELVALARFQQRRKSEV